MFPRTVNQIIRRSNHILLRGSLLRPIQTQTNPISRASPIGLRYQSSQNDSEEKLKEIVLKLQSDPEIVQILKDFQALLVEKGFDPLRPSMMSMMRLMAQSDVREQAGKLKTKLDESGIVLSPEHISQFMGFMKK